MPTDPRIVALVPAWNAAEFIKPTLDALLAQSYRNFEVLVSVDLSTDRTGEICDTYARLDSRIRVIKQTERQGFVGNTRALLAAATAEYICWAWHDDILLPDYFSTLVPILEGNPRAVCAFTDVELHQLNGGAFQTLRYTGLEGVADPFERAKRILWLPDNWWVPNRGLVRRRAAARVGGFKRHWAGEYNSDWPWAVHMAILGDHIRVPAVLCRKFMKVNSVSTSWHRNRRVNTSATLSCAREILRSDLTLAEKARLQLTIASVLKAFVTLRYEAREEFVRVSAYHRAAREAERHLKGASVEPGGSTEESR